MSKEIIDGLEHLSDSVDTIIDWLQNNEKQVDTTNVDYISNELNSFTSYLKDIDVKLGNIDTKINAYLDSVPNEPINDNPENEQFNQSLITLLSKIDELKINMDNINANVNIDINTDDITKIKEELSNINVNVDTSFIGDFINTIDNAINNIQDIKLKVNLDKIPNLDSLNLDLNIDTALERVNVLKNDLDNLNTTKEVDLKLTDNISNVLKDLETIKDIDANVVFKSNIESIIENIKSLDLDLTINLPKFDKENFTIDISSVLEGLDTYTSKLNSLKNIDLELNIKDNASIIIDKIKNDIDLVVSGYNDLKFNAFVDVLPNTENIDSFKKDLEQEFIIKPIIDLEQIEELMNTKFEINVETKPIIEKTTEEKVTNLVSINPIKEDNTLIKYVEQNNNVLIELTNVLKNMNTTIVNQKVETKTETVTNSNTIMNVEKDKPVNDLTYITDLLTQLVQTNSMIMKKMTKSGFNTDINF